MMQINTTFRHLSGKPEVKSYAHEKIGKLQKFLRQSMRADITLSIEGHDHIADVRVNCGDTHLHGSERSADFNTSIDLVVDKLEAQIRSRSSRRGRKSVRKMDPPPSTPGDEWL